MKYKAVIFNDFDLEKLLPRNLPGQKKSLILYFLTLPAFADIVYLPQSLISDDEFIKPVIDFLLNIKVKVGISILESLNLRQRKLEIVSCPSCGRAQVDVYTLAEQVTAGLEGLEVPLRVAVMGCVVNGPGEAREADLGVASGNGKGQIFVKGEVIKTVPESQIVETLIEEAMKLAEEAA